MYTLINGKKVENLTFAQGNESWEISPYYWDNGILVHQAYNTETGEIKIYDRKGNEIYLVKS